MADVEKLGSPSVRSRPIGHPETQFDSPAQDSTPPPLKGLTWYHKLEAYLVSHNLESRGIRRVDPSERHDTKNLGYLQVGLLWFSINLAANNITLGMLGPVVFSLGFRDAALLAVFGAIVGCIPVAYIATFGPRSGNRTLVVARYAMGWWPAKLIVLLNIIVSTGYSMIDAVVAGQILSAVSPANSLSIIVGIVIVSVLTWLITIFGYRIVHYYERYAWLPQIVAVSVLAGVSARHFDISSPTTGDTALTRTGNRLSFFSLNLSAAITYGGAAADYFVYYPESTPKWKVFSATMAGLTTSFTYAFIIGIGLGSGVASIPAWSDAYNTSQGALIVQGFAPVGGFGKFCSVLIALGLVANMIPPTYSSGVDFQILGTAIARVPRVVWNTVIVVIYTVCAIAGRNHLAEIFTNFLALMGYFVAIWMAVQVEEHVLFRYLGGRGWNWEAWDDRSKLPVGVAALVAFLVGWAGAVSFCCAVLRCAVPFLLLASCFLLCFVL